MYLLACLKVCVLVLVATVSGWVSRENSTRAVRRPTSASTWRLVCRHVGRQ